MSVEKPPRRRSAPPDASGPPVIPAPRAAHAAPTQATPVARTAPAAPMPPSRVAEAPQASRLEEATRKLIRPSLPPASALSSARSGGAPRRREAPPDATGAEAALVAKLVATGADVEVRLETGVVVRGRIEWVDRACLKLRRDDGAPALVMKHAIVTLGVARRG